MIYIAGIGETDNRVDQQICFLIASSPECQLLMRAVHRVARLEGNDLAPA